jgi:hypothetical protein
MPGPVVKVEILHMADMSVDRADFLAIKLFEILKHGKLGQIYAFARGAPIGFTPPLAEEAAEPADI